MPDSDSPPPSNDERPTSDDLKAQIKADVKSQIPPLPDKNSTQEKILKYATARIKAAESHNSEATALRSQAEDAPPEEKDKLLALAAEHEKKSKAEMKAVNRLQSGTWQGAGMGGGMGAGFGMGLGAVVGTVVGGVVSIPTTGVGILAGAGTGAVHGPWFKVPGAEGMKKNREGGEGEEEGDEGKEGEDGEGG